LVHLVEHLVHQIGGLHRVAHHPIPEHFVLMVFEHWVFLACCILDALLSVFFELQQIVAEVARIFTECPDMVSGGLDSC
jgi:predicted membrane chloride channel (bestrophin family)